MNNVTPLSKSIEAVYVSEDKDDKKCCTYDFYQVILFAQDGNAFNNYDFNTFNFNRVVGYISYKGEGLVNCERVPGRDFVGYFDRTNEKLDEDWLEKQGRDNFGTKLK